MVTKCTYIGGLYSRVQKEQLDQLEVAVDKINDLHITISDIDQFRKQTVDLLRDLKKELIDIREELAVDEETNTKSDFLQLHDAYNNEDGLQEFVARINFFRKPSSAGNGGKGKVIPSIANFPMLAKQTTNSKL